MGTVELYMDKVVEKLDNINQTLEKMLASMQRPKSRFVWALEMLVLFCGALGIINIVDTIRKWIIGG
jgi:hypothetical protein